MQGPIRKGTNDHPLALPAQKHLLVLSDHRATAHRDALELEQLRQEIRNRGGTRQGPPFHGCRHIAAPLLKLFRQHPSFLFLGQHQPALLGLPKMTTSLEAMQEQEAAATAQQHWNQEAAANGCIQAEARHHVADHQDQNHRDAGGEVAVEVVLNRQGAAG